MSDAADLLAVLAWSTSQGDAAMEGADTFDRGGVVADCPYPSSSTLAHPWRAGWIATGAEAVSPPNLSGGRRTGKVSVVLRASGAAAELGVRLWAEQISASTGPGR